jgi:hypothetical protein
MHGKDVLDRRSFLSLTASGVFGLATRHEGSDSLTEEYWKSQGYRVAQVLSQVDQVFVRRGHPGLRVEFVDYETMRGTNLRLASSAEIGFYTVGPVPYGVSLWFPARGSALEAFVTLESTTGATILVHRERGNAVVVLEAR